MFAKLRNMHKQMDFDLWNFMLYLNSIYYFILLINASLCPCAKLDTQICIWILFPYPCPGNDGAMPQKCNQETILAPDHHIMIRGRHTLGGSTAIPRDILGLMYDPREFLSCLILSLLKLHWDNNCAFAPIWLAANGKGSEMDHYDNL